MILGLHFLLIRELCFHHNILKIMTGESVLRPLSYDDDTAPKPGQNVVGYRRETNQSVRASAPVDPDKSILRYSAWSRKHSPVVYPPHPTPSVSSRKAFHSWIWELRQDYHLIPNPVFQRNAFGVGCCPLFFCGSDDSRALLVRPRLPLRYQRELIRGFPPWRSVSLKSFNFLWLGLEWGGHAKVHTHTHFEMFLLS